MKVDSIWTPVAKFFAALPDRYRQGAAYARGSGAEVSGPILGGANGLAPTTQNYALGLTVQFPVPEHAPAQPANREPVAAVALRVTELP